jgi:hypothetical protein
MHATITDATSIMRITPDKFLRRAIDRCLELRLHKKNREEQAREVNNLSREETSGGKSQAAPAGSGASV